MSENKQAANDSEFAIAKYTNGQTNAFVKKVMQQSGHTDILELVLSGKVTLTIKSDAPVVEQMSVPKWTEVNNRFCFQVSSNGKTGAEWSVSLQKQGFRVSSYAESILLSDDFKPTNGVTYEVVVLKGISFASKNRVTKKIRAEATKSKLMAPNAEVVCLIRELLTDEDLKAMGLWYIVAMHEPIKDSDGDPFLLHAYRHDDGAWLHAYYGKPVDGWDEGGGFAFVAQ